MATVALWGEVKGWDNVLRKIEIVKVAGGTSPLEVERSFKMTRHYVGEDKEYKPIRQCAVEWGFYASAAVEAVVDAIYADDEGAYQLYYYEDGVQKYTGVVLVDDYEEPDEFSPVRMKLIASDLAVLKNETVTYTGGSQSPLAVLVTELGKTGFSLAFEIVNELYPSGASDDSFANTTFDPATFYDADKDEAENCYAAVEQLMLTYHLELFQKDNKWYLVQVSEIIGTSLRRRAYNSAGTYTGQTTGINPRSTIGTDVKLLKGGPRTRNRGYKYILSHYQYGENWALLNNDRFDQAYVGGEPPFWSLSSAFGPALKAYPGGVGTSIPTVDGTYPDPLVYNYAASHVPGNYLYQTGGLIVLQGGVDTRLQVYIDRWFNPEGDPMVTIPSWAMVKVGSNYLQYDGSWTATPTVFILGFTQFSSSKTIVTDPLPSGGYIYVEIGGSVKLAGYTDGGPLIASRFTIDIFEGDTLTLESRLFRGLSTAKTFEELDLGTTRLGDGPSSSHPGCIFYSGSPTASWTSGMDAVGRLSHFVMVKNMMRLFGNSRYRYDSTFKSAAIDPMVVPIRNGTPFKVLDSEQDLIKAQSKVTMVELSDESGISVTFVQEDSTENSAGGKTTVISAGGSGAGSGGSADPDQLPRSGYSDVAAGDGTINFTPFTSGTDYSPVVEGWELDGSNETGNKIDVKASNFTSSSFDYHVAEACRIRYTMTPSL